MKKRTLAAWAVMVLGMGAMAQQVSDPVVMKINGKEVTNIVRDRLQL